MHEDSAKTIQETGPDAIVILCHGFGAGGSDLVPCTAELIGTDDRLKNVLFVFPAAPIELDPMMDSRAWWPLDMEKFQQMMLSGETRDLRGESPVELPECRRMISAIIDSVCSGFGLSADKVVVGGFSQGSMLATDVALHHGEPLGGLIVWSGALLCESEWIAAATAHAPITVYQSHGKTDPILSFSGAELLREMLVAHGHQVEFDEFPGEHTIPAVAIEGAKKLIRGVVG